MEQPTTVKEEAIPASKPRKKKEEAQEEASSATAEGSDPKGKESRDAARYAALRNHRIRFEDAIDPNAERVLDLRKDDIVFGRGRGFQNHPGNLRMREIIDKYKTQYHSLKRAEKREMVENVYTEIIEGGARFLKRLDDEDVWIKVDVPVALQKVSHTLRCRKNLEKHLMVNTEETGVLMSSSSALVRGLGGGVGPVQAAGLHGIVPNPGLNMGLFGSSDAFSAGFEAQRMAALNRYRAFSAVPSIQSGMPMVPGAVGMPGGMDYYNMMRREQLIRETMMFQQMGDAARMESTSVGANSRIPNAPGMGPMPISQTAATLGLRGGRIFLPDINPENAGEN